MNTGIPQRVLAGLSALCLASCASAPPSAEAIGTGSSDAAAGSGGVLGLLGSAADKAMELTGIKAPAKPTELVPDSALPDRRVQWRLHASSSLNVTDSGQSLALVTRIFKLRGPDSFLQAPIDAFGDAAREKQALGDDLVSVREVQLLPGQHHEFTDKVARDVPYIGIVGLYRRPATGRWRYAFKASEAEQQGLSLGAHACAMSVQTGTAVGTSAPMARSVAVNCP